MDPASRLRAAREASGLTQAAVSRATGIAVPNLSKIENGKVDIRLSTLTRILDALGIELQFALRTTGVSIDEVTAWSRQGRNRIAAAGLAPSAPQERLDAKANRGIDVATEQALLNPNA